MQFNLSHAGDLALVAVSHGRRLGIDVERVRDDLALDRLAEFVFSTAELDAWHRVPPPARTTAFFAAWTRKEAYVKALGRGLSLSPKSFAVSPRPDEKAALLWSEGDPAAPRRWTLRALPVWPGYAAAVAVEGRVRRVLIWQWPAL